MSKAALPTLVPDTKKVLDRDEAAKYLTDRGIRTSRHGILRLRDKGLEPIPFEKTAGKAYWRRSDLDAWIDSL